MLVLKKKCLVILLRNLGGPCVNGLQGTVAKLGDDGLTIRSSNGTTVAIPKSSFDVRVSSKARSNATSVQYPMKLAYKLTYTVHKTKYTTSDCELWRLFRPGQLGVAMGEHWAKVTYKC